MKYIKLYEYYNDLELELTKYNIYDYTINNDNTIDVNSNVYLSSKNLIEIPLQFGNVDVNFLCYSNKLTSLKGSPNYVGGYFSCQFNKLTSLEYAPKYVGGDFSCNNNQLTNLEYAPKYVGGDFSCNNNDIKYIQPDIKIEGYFYIRNNPISIIFTNSIDNKQILEELAIYNPISKDGSTIYKTKLKDMYRQLGKLNKFNDDINRLSEYYKII